MTDLLFSGHEVELTCLIVDILDPEVHDLIVLVPDSRVDAKGIAKALDRCAEELLACPKRFFSTLPVRDVQARASNETVANGILHCDVMPIPILGSRGYSRHSCRYLG